MNGQDRHFTLYPLSPLNLNPGLAGAFHGSFRIGGIVRDQDRAIAGKGAYNTFGFTADVPLIEGLRKKDWIGFGINYYRDGAGSTGRKITGTHINVAYHAGFGPKTKTTSVLALGVQFGSIRRTFDASMIDPLTDNFDLLDGFGIENDFDISDDLGRYNDDNADQAGGTQQGGGNGATFSDWNVGLTYKATLNKKSNIELGAAVYHIQFGQKTRFDSISMQAFVIEPILKPRITTYLSFENKITEKITLNPKLLVQTTRKTLQIVPQVLTSILVSEEKKMKLVAGIGARIVSAPDLQLMIGLDIKDIRVMTAFDLNMASATAATNGFRGVELGVLYIGKIYKKPKPIPILICPRH